MTWRGRKPFSTLQGLRVAEPLRLLMVCLGNICRSPMAEGALRSRLQAARMTGVVDVDSAGLGNWHVGQPPDPRAVACAARHGVDISGQRARQLRDADFLDFDWLLCADASVMQAVLARQSADAGARVALLRDATATGSGDIADPYTGSSGDFDRVWEQVDAAAAAIVVRRGLDA